jgi:hypothetical protein
MLKENKREFEETFGRKPRANDAVFFQKYYSSKKDFERETIKAMEGAGAAPSVVYAYRKTGFIITERNFKKLTPQEQEEWNEAIDEFYGRLEDGEDKEVILGGDGLKEFMQDAIRRNQVVAGSFVEKHFNRYRRKPGSDRDVDLVAAFATTNFTRGLKSIHILLENDVGFDAYHLLRVLYENYLVLKYVYEHPQEVVVFAAQLGTLLGTHVFATSKTGAPIQSQIVETSTGSKVNVPSRWAMATALGALDQQLYNEIYRLLSSYTHSEITNVRHFLSDSGFDYLNPDFTFDVLVICHLLSLLFFACLKRNCSCAKYLQGDLSKNAERSLYALKLVERSRQQSDRDGLPNVYAAALADVVKSDARLKRVYDASDKLWEKVAS